MSAAKSTLKVRREKPCYRDTSGTGLGAEDSPASSEGDLEDKGSCLRSEGA